MKTNVLILILFVFSSLIIVNSQQQYVYTIHYVKSFRQDLIQKYLGCHEKSIAYGSYIYPHGAMDALFIFSNPGSYLTHFNSQTHSFYQKLFGTQQNYQQLISADPDNVANQIIRGKSRSDWKYIIDWKHSLTKNTQNSRNWLNRFIQKLQQTNIEVYVKAPASYFCYLNSGLKYLLDLDKANNYIIQMYGQQPGVYTTYEDIFQKNTSKGGKSDTYSQECPKFPSYSTLVKNFPNKKFWIQKTLHKQNAGYIGPKFAKFLQQAKDVYGKAAFLDSFPQQILQL